jgi:hypothetical protein
MPRLILHAGGPKTGSSLLQVLLAQESDRLAAAGTVVPPGRETDAARQGMISSGNGLELANFLNTSLKHFREAGEYIPPTLTKTLQEAAGHNVVFSSEFIDCIPGPRMNVLLNIVNKYGYDIEFVLYVRNIDSAAYSFYSQSVKRSNNYHDFETFLKRWRPPYLGRIERAATCLPANALRIFNYHSRSKHIARHFFDEILGVTPPEAMPKVVNRSLTFSELNIIKKMNAKFPKNNMFSTFVSDAIIYNTTAPKDYGFCLTPAEADELHRRFDDYVAQLNAWLGAEPVDVIGPDTVIGERQENELSEVESVVLAVLTALVEDHVASKIAARRKARQSAGTPPNTLVKPQSDGGVRQMLSALLRRVS